MLESEITRLASGLRVVTRHLPATESVAIGCWIDVGSRDERDAEHGMAHMLEHMVFKGTENRTALDIVREVEDKGGYINAHTSREETAYYLRLLSEDLEFGLHILSDIVLNSTHPCNEIEREKGVIIQEIGQSLDTPDDVIFDIFQSISYPSSNMGRPILGTDSSVNCFNRDDIFAFQNRHYGAESMVISAAGCVDHDALVKLVEQYFSKAPAILKPARTFAGWAEQSAIKLQEAALEQTHLVFGLKGVSIVDDRRLALSVLSMLYGGGMSSRLFQEAREKQGLCYSVLSFNQHFSDGGVFGVYAGTAETDAKKMIQIAGEQLKDVAAHATKEETTRAKAQMRSSFLMQQESAVSVAEQQARQVLLLDNVKSPQDWLSDLAQITVDDIRDVAAFLLSTPAVLASIGTQTGGVWLDESSLEDALNI